MAPFNNRFRHVGRVATVGLAALTAALVVPVSTLTASASTTAGNARNGMYLALGDSVAFGYIPPDATPAPNYFDAHSFVSYANYVSSALDVHLSNASCPGETTASMLYPGAQSNGCENSVGTTVGYRNLYPLHVQYAGTQTAYAVNYLTDHKNTTLVTIDIGANDAFVCEETTADHCSSPAELEAVGAEIAANLSAIFFQIRDVAHYSGPLVTLDYYSLNYNSATDDEQSAFLNSVVNEVTEAFGGIVADGYGAFQAASGPGGDPCTAGLLIPVPGGCNIHPTQLGHQVLAAAIVQALVAAGD